MDFLTNGIYLLLQGEHDDVEVEQDDGLPNLIRFCFGRHELVALGDALDLGVTGVVGVEGVVGNDRVNEVVEVVTCGSIFWSEQSNGSVCSLVGVVGMLVTSFGSMFSFEGVNRSGNSAAR